MPLNSTTFEVQKQAPTQAPVLATNDATFDEMIVMLQSKGEGFAVKDGDSAKYSGGRKIELDKCHNIDHARDGKMAIWIDAATGGWCGGCRGGDCQGQWSFRQWFAVVFPGLAEPPLTITDELFLARHVLGNHSRGGVPTLRYFDGNYYLWDGFYRTLDDQEARNLIYTESKKHAMECQAKVNAQREKMGKAVVPAPKIGTTTVANTSMALQTLVGVQQVGWNDNRSGRWIAFSDKILDLDAWVAGRVECVDQTPEYFDPHALNYSLDYTDQEPELFLEKLHEQFQPREVAAFQEFGGYCFTTETDVQRILGIFGPPRSFKGTANRVLQASIGRHNTVAKTFESFVSSHALEDAVGKTLLVLADSRPDPRFSRAGVEKLLSISGQDTVNINPKNRKHFDADLVCKIMILANILPDFSDESGALLARFLFLQSTKTFAGREDKDLTNKILREQNSVTWWFLRGLRRLLQNGRYTEPENNLREKFEYKNNPIPSFVRNMCEVTGRSEDRILPSELFKSYENWSIPYEVAPTSDNTFFRELYRHYPAINRTNNYIRGIRWLVEPVEDEDSITRHLIAA